MKRKKEQNLTWHNGKLHVLTSQFVLVNFNPKTVAVTLKVTLILQQNFVKHLQLLVVELNPLSLLTHVYPFCIYKFTLVIKFLSKFLTKFYSILCQNNGQNYIRTRPFFSALQIPICIQS